MIKKGCKKCGELRVKINISPSVKVIKSVSKWMYPTNSEYIFFR